ncbi:FAD-binding oxidoreductase [Granulicella sp. dw_53]|uniref:FAD-binding oxidoreductase n=1 Tax=Granulicella sp. dw_53 TaxID=2719792 RepID=UPI001BD20BF0|nr:FAD-binding oxidoreductase [Granulicella sp. dw_53]
MPTRTETAITEELTDLQISFVDSAHKDYDQARALWNGRFDRKPAIVAYPGSAEQIVELIRIARTEGLSLAVRSAGHDAMGASACNEGIVIDLTRMKSISVDTANRIGTAQAGVTIGEFIEAIQEKNLIVTFGSHGTVGIAGYTLGGGIGILMNRYGLLSDNLLSAEIVTADGTIMQVSAKENPDLFWAIRGGGGNFGIVTSFTYQLHPVEPTLAGIVMHPVSQAKEALLFYREFTRNLPDAISVFAVIMGAPDGTPIFAFFASHIGPLDEGERLLAPLRAFGTPIMDLIAPVPPGAILALTSDRDPAGHNYAFDTRALAELSDEAIAEVVKYGNERTSPDSAVVVYEIHGAARRPDQNHSAVPLRHVPYVIGMYSGWHSEDETPHLAWMQAFKEALDPISVGPGPITLSGLDSASVGAAYRHQYKRLQQIKAKYDPENIFCNNRNITPQS